LVGPADQIAEIVHVLGQLILHANDQGAPVQGQATLGVEVLDEDQQLV
jgi:hypothetical protein